MGGDFFPRICVKTFDHFLNTKDTVETHIDEEWCLLGLNDKQVFAKYATQILTFQHDKKELILK